MKISLELVPRDHEHIRAQAGFANRTIPQISAINFPDLLRFPIRSWEACKICAGIPLETIAHLRAIDFDTHKPFPLTAFLTENQITKLLVVEGDKPQDMRRPVYPTSSIDLIRKLRSEMPQATVYAAFDPYRTNIRHELEYLKLKLEAGASGFFSQPFFDLRLLEIYAEYLNGLDVYWGVSPVTSQQSRLYWEIRNRAIFPRAFQPTIEWNIRFTQQVIHYCRQASFNLYLMPIRINLQEYLTRLFL